MKLMKVGSVFSERARKNLEIGAGYQSGEAAAQAEHGFTQVPIASAGELAASYYPLRFG
jgi:hypothetical protein